MANGGRSLEEIGKRITAVREMLGMNKTAFAAFLDVTQPAISQYEDGKRRPDLDVGIRIRLRTGVTLDWIYEGDRGGLPIRLANSLPDLDDQQSGSRQAR